MGIVVAVGVVVLRMGFADAVCIQSWSQKERDNRVVFAFARHSVCGHKETRLPTTTGGLENNTFCAKLSFYS